MEMVIYIVKTYGGLLFIARVTPLKSGSIMHTLNVISSYSFIELIKVAFIRLMHIKKPRAC